MSVFVGQDSNLVIGSMEGPAMIVRLEPPMVP